MIKSKSYKYIKKELRKLKYQKELYKNLNAIYKIYRFSEYDFHADIKLMQHKFKLNIDSSTSQKIASHLWKAYDKLFFGNSKQINYKKYGSLNALEGKSNKSGIRLKNNKIYWLGLELPIKINDKNEYERYALEQPICYNRIIRKFIKGAYKYYIQIIFKGKPFIKHGMNYGDVGIDIGTRTIAICSQYDVKLYELADKVPKLESQKNIIQRKLDRSKKGINPDNFKEDGTIQKGIKLEWNYSKNYIKNKNLLKKFYRKQTVIRKLQHEILANEILTLGSNVYVERMNFQGLQRRSKETTKNKNGKINKKKRFGKSLGNKAPAMLLEILDRKLKYHGEELHKVNTYKIKASQYNHEEDVYKKKKLSQRWTIVGEYK